MISRTVKAPQTPLMLSAVIFLMGDRRKKNLYMRVRP